ncbi:MAG: NAD-dependent epimerase/dehydratase family protein [Thermodesulfobacteriota bacterium]|nr:NAD-dependent epimerase/dehydratase family protein [Thermodesulfobacteriota bacterium]
MISSSPSAAGGKKGLAVVLGGLGFMGSHTCRELLARGFAVRIFGRPHSPRARIQDIEEQVEVVGGDISQPEEIMNAIEDASTLIHFIHSTVPGSSMDDPAYDVTNNIVSSVKWLRRLRDTDIQKIVYVSTGGAVYGLPQSVPLDENHPTNPICSYGITKLAIEKYVTMYASMYGVEYRILRPANVYGVGQRLDIGQGVIGVLLDHALRGEELEIWGTGRTVRDYLYVDDMVDATMKLLEYSGPHRIFNVSRGEGHSVVEIVEILRNHIGSVPPVVHVPDRGFDVPVNVLDSSRLCRETGWRAHVGLETGIARTFEWLRNRQRQEGRNGRIVYSKP